MNIILAGIMGRYPYGGVAWCSLMYLLGLHRLGHRVWYLEDTGECNYDPIENTKATNPRYALEFIRNSLEPYGLGDAWCYIDYAGNYHGHDRPGWTEVCRGADLFLNLSGGCWFWRDEYASIPHTAFIDSDPAFTQLAIAKATAGGAEAGAQWYVDFFRRFDSLFTFGRNVGTPACSVPTSGLRWHHTWQPVVMDEWQPRGVPRPTLTTIMTWAISSFADIGGNKDVELQKVLDLPSRVKVPLELALASVPEARAMLRQHGWNCRDAFQVSHGLHAYRDYVRSSLGEFSVAKHTYVRTRSGWFSDRTACYLAAGRPAVVQETGFGAHIPTGEGLFAWRTADEAVAAIDAVVSDYPRHSRAARDLAAANFSSDVVLEPLVERATSPRSSREGPLSLAESACAMEAGEPSCECRR